VEITAALAADLAILSEALDEPDADIGRELRQLVAHAQLAVRSYLGLTLIADNGAFPLTLTTMQHFAHPDDVVSSLLIPLWDHDIDVLSSELAVVLYAARPGAFVDLAADLSWLTGRQLSDFLLDQHLGPPAEADRHGGVLGASLLNQAIGVLIGRGYSPEQAELEIDARAAAAGHLPVDAAALILREPPAADGTNATLGT
jgi:hypothetical protein